MKLVMVYRTYLILELKLYIVQKYTVGICKPRCAKEDVSTALLPEDAFNIIAINAVQNALTLTMTFHAELEIHLTFYIL